MSEPAKAAFGGPVGGAPGTGAGGEQRGVKQGAGTPQEFAPAHAPVHGHLLTAWYAQSDGTLTPADSDCMQVQTVMGASSYQDKGGCMLVCLVYCGSAWALLVYNRGKREACALTRD